MSSLLYSLGRAAFRARRVVVVGWVLALVLAGAAAGLFSVGTSNSFVIPGTASQAALDELGTRFPEVAGAQAQMVVVAAAGQTVNDADVQAAISASIARLQQVETVTTVADPYSPMVAGSLSDDGRAAVVAVQLSSAWEDVTDVTRDQLIEAGAPIRDLGATVEFGGQVFNSTGPALSLIEALGVLIALIVLLVTFGSLRAAGMPLVTALVGVGFSMAVILAISDLVVISSTVPLLALMLGLAVGIDYALFILSRHRDQLAEGMEPEESAARAIATAGSAVVFAGLTVIIALVGLAVARIPFLTTMGLAAAGAVLIAVLVALTLLPAILGFSGAKLTPKAKRSTRPTKAQRSPFAARWVRVITARPLITIVLVVVSLGALAVPAKDLRLALPDNGTAPIGSTQREAFDLIAEHFGPGYNAPLLVTADIIRTTDPVGVVNQIADRIRQLPQVDQITTATPNPTADTGIIVVIPDASADAASTKELVAQVRGLEAEFQNDFGVRTAVTGQAALAIDVSDRLGGALLPFGILVVGLSLILLGVVFRSIVVPIKATVGYLLSVGASFGAVAAVFEWGWLAEALGVDRTGPVISFMPIILMGVLFGLAMDYEVFLVSRMREEYVHTGNPEQALTVGYVAGARVVTAAALIMVAVFAAFVPHGDANIKPIALALAVGVFVDAFVVRMIFVPAVLALLGHAAWWLPRWLDRRLPRLDIEGDGLRAELATADWPNPGSPAVIHAEGLRLEGPQGVVFADVNLSVRPGTVLVVHGPPGSGRTALLLALAGRMPVSGGRFKVAGHGLPGSGRSARAVRARVGLAETAGINDLEDPLTVEQHVTERIAAQSPRLWVSRTAVLRVLGSVHEAYLSAGRTPSLDRRTLVADLSPFDRKMFGIALALIGSPTVLIVDNADDLRDPADREALWQALSGLVSQVDPPQQRSAPQRLAQPDQQQPDQRQRRQPLTVIASSARPVEAMATVRADRLQLLDLATNPSLFEKVR